MRPGRGPQAGQGPGPPRGDPRADAGHRGRGHQPRRQGPQLPGGTVLGRGDGRGPGLGRFLHGRLVGPADQERGRALAVARQDEPARAAPDRRPAAAQRSGAVAAADLALPREILFRRPRGRGQDPARPGRSLPGHPGPGRQAGPDALLRGAPDLPGADPEARPRAPGTLRAPGPLDDPAPGRGHGAQPGTLPHHGRRQGPGHPVERPGPDPDAHGRTPPGHAPAPALQGPVRHPARAGDGRLPGRRRRRPRGPAPRPGQGLRP